jgi:hypothetical protein
LIFEDNYAIGPQGAKDRGGIGAPDVVKDNRIGRRLIKNSRFSRGDIETVPLQEGGLGSGDLQHVSVLRGMGRSRNHRHSLRAGVAFRADQKETKSDEDKLLFHIELTTDFPARPAATQKN